jgi:TolB-like protein
VIYLFEDCALDTSRRELRRGARSIDLEPQVFDVLEFLICNRDRVVSRDDLIESVWSGRIISESTLSSRINAARSAIGDDGASQRLIRTVPRKGFRFVGTIREEAEHQAKPQEPAPVAQMTVASARRDGPSIAVLPFTNMSGDAESDHIGDGIAEDIITALWRHGGLTVIARNSSFTFRNSSVDVREIARDLGADYILEGSIRRFGDSVRITAQLIEAASGAHLWAERFDPSRADIFEIQDRITERAVSIIEPTVRFAEAEHARRRPSQDLTTYDLRMRALSLATEFTEESMAAALHCLEQALKIDPSYAIAMAASAFYRAQCRIQGWTPEANEPTAKGAELAWSAVKLAKDDPIVLWMAAFSTWVLERDVRRSRELFRRSLQINANSSVALSLAGLVDAANGNGVEGRKLIERARLLNPRPPREWLNLTAMAIACLAEDKFDEALAWAERSLVQNRRFVLSFSALAVARAEVGDVELAKQTVQELLAIDPQLRIATLPARLPSMDSQLLKLYVAALSKAGLPG